VAQLPIDPHLPEIVARLRTGDPKEPQNLIIQASPGAGKTTRVAPALLDAGVVGPREIIVLEPRRIAARLAARRVAEERGERLGQTIGYQVRYEDVSSAGTRIRFVTEGVLTRRLLVDPELRRIGAVILDEFHERHLQADLALALLRRLQRERRPDLQLIVMSATLDARPVQAFLGNALAISVEGRRFEIAIEHLARPDDRPLAEQVAGAVSRLVNEGLDGDLLVFLPGAAEIKRAAVSCQRLAEQHRLLVVPLHGELPAAEQDRAVRPADRRKVILSTNVAESSVTIDGVVAVIDSGLARTAGHSPWSGLPHLNVSRISQAAAVQRAGRAGRTRPGRCLRLYTAADFAARPAFEAPEIMRIDLAEPVLELHAAGVVDPARFEWYEQPPRESTAAAEALLERLGAIDGDGTLTETGRRMLTFPLHPRLSRLLVESERRGVGDDGAIIAAIVSERDIVARDLFGAGRERPAARHSGPSDLLDRLDRFRAVERHKFAPDAVRNAGLDVGAVAAADRVRTRLSRMRHSKDLPLDDQPHEDALLISILAGYPDRVARRRAVAREKGSTEIEALLSGGGQAVLAATSVVRQSDFFVAVDAEDRRAQSSAKGRPAAGIEIRLASEIKADWLLDHYLDAVREVDEVKWNAAAERVEGVRQLLYDRLVIDETRLNLDSNPEVAEAAGHLLSEAAQSAGIETFFERTEIDSYLARLDFVARLTREVAWPEIGMREVENAFADLCRGRRSFDELRAACGRGGLRRILNESLTTEQRRLLDRLAPERLSLHARRQVKIEYEGGKNPWIASRLQDFFGMRDGPRIGDGRVPLVLHLLAPNQRPVQVTADLAGFWTRHYPQIRRELSRRYPRHAWPEDPLNVSGR
jgi:ATP-dependent helicase HrpB